ncbi:hypothetical protein GCM10028819_40520 [Spirosoma humi]
MPECAFVPHGEGCPEKIGPLNSSKPHPNRGLGKQSYYLPADRNETKNGLAVMNLSFITANPFFVSLHLFFPIQKLDA